MNDVEDRFYDSLEDENNIETPSWNPNPPFLIELPYFIKGEYENNKSSIEIINQMFQNAQKKPSEWKNTKKNLIENKQTIQHKQNLTNSLTIKNLTKFNQTIQNQNQSNNNTTENKNIGRSKSVNIKLKSPKDVAEKITNNINLQKEIDLIEYYELKLKELKQKNSKFTLKSGGKDAVVGKHPNKAEISLNDDKYSKAKKRDHQNYLRSFRSKSSISEKSFNQFGKLLQYEFSTLESNKNLKCESDERSSSTDISKKSTSYASEIDTCQSNLNSSEIKSNLFNSENGKERILERQMKSPNSISDSEEETNRRAPHTSRSQCRNLVQKNIKSVRKISKGRTDSYLEIYQQKSQLHNGTRRVSKSPKTDETSTYYPKMESLDSEEQQLYHNILSTADTSNFKPVSMSKFKILFN